MEEIKNYIFTEQEFKQVEKLVDEIYNLGIVLNSFCKTNADIEEIQNLSPILKYLHKNTDILNCIFINKT